MEMLQLQCRAISTSMYMLGNPLLPHAFICSYKGSLSLVSLKIHIGPSSSFHFVCDSKISRVLGRGCLIPTGKPSIPSRKTPQSGSEASLNNAERRRSLKGWPGSTQSKSAWSGSFRWRCSTIAPTSF